MWGGWTMEPRSRQSCLLVRRYASPSLPSLPPSLPLFISPYLFSLLLPETSSEDSVSWSAIASVAGMLGTITFLLFSVTVVSLILLKLQIHSKGKFYGVVSNRSFITLSSLILMMRLNVRVPSSRFNYHLVNSR